MGTDVKLENGTDGSISSATIGVLPQLWDPTPRRAGACDALIKKEMEYCSENKIPRMTQEMTQAEIDKMTPLGWTKETVYPKPDATPRTQLKNEETAAITEELFVFLTDGGDTFNEQQIIAAFNGHMSKRFDFKSMDKNANGYVDKREWQVYIEKLAAKFPDEDGLGSFLKACLAAIKMNKEGQAIMASRPKRMPEDLETLQSQLKGTWDENEALKRRVSELEAQLKCGGDRLPKIPVANMMQDGGSDAIAKHLEDNPQSAERVQAEMLDHNLLGSEC